MASDNGDFKFIEVKVHADGLRPIEARRIVAKGVVGVLAGGPISASSKVIFDRAGIWYRENVEPSDLNFHPGQL